MYTGNNYWVLEWLRENCITSLGEAAALLPKYRVLDSLQQRAEDAIARREKTLIHTPSIVAGTGVDLWGGRMVCPSPSCMRSQVDRLFKHVWHYFDTIVVDDVLAQLLSQKWDGSKKELIDEILQQLAPLLYLEEIKGSDFVEFRPKHRCIVEHWEEHANDVGLGILVDSKDQLLANLINRSEFSRETKGGRTWYNMTLPEAEITITSAKEQDEKQAHLSLANTFLREYMADLIADVLAASEHGLPLGSVQGFQAQMLQMSRPTSVADVVFQLQLPVLEGISTADLIAIRRDQSEYFLNFRNSLTRAAQEHLKLQPTGSGAEIAEEIRADVIEPELESIRIRLASAERSLVKKTSVATFLGAVATTCGLLACVAPPLAISAGVAATLGIAGPAVSKHLDEERDVSLSNMYFLWKAIGHVH
jgi:hypothetical protein